jgi:hypothetical protein
MPQESAATWQEQCQNASGKGQKTVLGAQTSAALP